jgi:hypothetical protein
VSQVGPADNVTDKVWKQCFKQNAEGVYVIDTAKTADARGFDFLKATDAGVPAPELSMSKLEGVNP